MMKVRCILWTAIITVPALINSRKMKVRCINYYIFYSMDSHNNSTCTDQQQKDEGKMYKLLYILWIAIVTVPALISSRMVKVKSEDFGSSSSTCTMRTKVKLTAAVMLMKDRMRKAHSLVYRPASVFDCTDSDSSLVNRPLSVSLIAQIATVHWCTGPCQCLWLHRQQQFIGVQTPASVFDCTDSDSSLVYRPASVFDCTDSDSSLVHRPANVFDCTDSDSSFSAWPINSKGSHNIVSYK